MRKVFALCSALLLTVMLAVPAFADVWIPPTDDGSYNEALERLPHSGEAAKALNVFLSNYIAAGLTCFDTDTDDDTVACTVLKYLEQHPDLYPGSVAAYTDADGAACMRVAADAFEACADSLFERSIRAESCPGYADGSIYVTAEAFGAPAQCFAFADFCQYQGMGRYHIYFLVYAIESDVGDCYALNNPAETEGLREVGYGTVELTLLSDPDATEFNVSDFSLNYLFCDTDLPTVAENLPAEPEEAPPVAAPAIPSTAPETGTASASAGLSGKAITIIVVVVALLAAGAAAAIIVIWRKKR